MLSIAQKSNVSHQIIHQLPTISTLKTLLIAILEITVIIFEYIIGIIIGAAGGWFVGWCSGHIYQDLCEPKFLATYEEIEFWYYLPHTFGQYSAVIAAHIGVLVIYAISLKQLIHESESSISEK